MASLSEIKPNIAGIRAVLKSGGVIGELWQYIDPIRDRANDSAVERDAEYKSYVDMGKYTAIGKVVCGNAAAVHDNHHNNTLLKAR